MVPATPGRVESPSSSDLEAVVRAALAGTYSHPVVLSDGDRVAVLGGRALEQARAAAEAHDPGAGQRVVALDVASLPWHAITGAGCTLWRQHGRAEAEGEVVTQLDPGDPPLQVVVEEDGWLLVRCVDGAQGWLDPRDASLLQPSPPPPDDVADAKRVDVEAFVREAQALEGAPYVWGGTRDSGVDCSGLVQRAAWRAGGCWLPRHSRALLGAAARVAPSTIARGDVLVLQRNPDTLDEERRAQLAALAAQEQRTGRVTARGPAVHPMHVAIALSPDEVLHASRDAMRVTRESLDAVRARYRVLGVRRLGAQPAGSSSPKGPPA